MAVTKHVKNSVPAGLIALWLLSVLTVGDIVENPFYDHASLLDSAQRWAAGEVPYRDFQPMYPPLSLWLYGLAMRLISPTYATAVTLAALLALLNLLVHYALARLLLPRRLALLSATATYLLLFANSSGNGPNFITLGTVFLGVGLFGGLVWAVARLLASASAAGTRWGAAGLLAGLCLLHKHEQIVGVAAILGFLTLHRMIGRRSSSVRLLAFAAPMLIVALTGYAYQAHVSGAFYLSAALQAYGTSAEHAMRNFPSLKTVWLQVVLLAAHTGLFLGVAACFLSREIRTRAWILASLLLAAAALAGGFEGLAAYRQALGADWTHARAVPNSMAVFGMLSHGANPATATVQYLGGIVYRNILPMLLVCGILACLGLRRLTGCREGWRALGGRRMVIALMIVALAGTQIRALFTYSSYGTLELALPLLLALSPLLVPRWGRPPLTPAGVGRLRLTYASLWAAAGLLLAGAVYAYEFRDSRWNPRLVATEHGMIRLVRLPEYEAFADMVEYVRSNRTDCVVAVPHEGLQYWTGGRTPFSWSYIIHPGLYHHPWSDNLASDLATNDITFVVYEHSEVIAQYLPQFRVDLIDGPWYELYRWKEAFPGLWQRVKAAQLLQRFPAQGAPYFSVYRARPATSSL